MLAVEAVVQVTVQELAVAVLHLVEMVEVVLDLTLGMEPQAVQTQVVAVAVEEDRLLLQQAVQV
jgi:hypothetical protein